MSRFAMGIACWFLALSVPSAAWADDGRWEYRADVTTTTGLFGYRPGKIVADDSPNAFVASENQSARTEIRGRLRIVGEWAELDVEPYTIVPAEQIRVNVGGVEITLLAPFASWGKVGLYHHSSHNFSDATYGWGIDLNAVVLDLRLLDGGVTLFGEEGRYRLRFLGHGYLRGKASPYVLTASSSIAPASIGDTAWRAGLLFEGAHPGGRADCSILAASDAAVPTSMLATCALTFTPGPRFFGTLGEHLYAGPFVGYGRNFSRLSEFGTDTFFGGIRVDLIFAESHAKPLGP